MRHVMIQALICFIALSGVSLYGQTVTQKRETLVTVNGKHQGTVIVETMTIKTVPQCQPKYCDSDDVDCDGIVDQGCPGLPYDVCVDGSIGDAYREAAFSGACIQPEPPENCDDLTVSPNRCDDE